MGRESLIFDFQTVGAVHVALAVRVLCEHSSLISVHYSVLTLARIWQVYTVVLAALVPQCEQKSEFGCVY